MGTSESLAPSTAPWCIFPLFLEAVAEDPREGGTRASWLAPGDPDDCIKIKTHPQDIPHYCSSLWGSLQARAAWLRLPSLPRGAENRASLGTKTSMETKEDKVC